MWRNEINLVKQAIKDYPLSEFWTRGIEGVDGEKPTHNSELFEDILIMVKEAGYDLRLVFKRSRGRPKKKRGGG
jgi:hypothetical protein